MKTRNDCLITKIIKGSYEFELRRRNELNNSIAFLVGVVTALIGGLVFLVNSAPENDTITHAVFLFFLGIAGLLTLISVILFFFHQVGHEYSTISTANDLKNYGSVKGFSQK